jgi:hypothetical protein
MVRRRSPVIAVHEGTPAGCIAMHALEGKKYVK